MAAISIVISGTDNASPALKSARGNVDTLATSMDKLQGRITTLGGAFLTYLAADKIAAGFMKGVEAVDEFNQSVIKTAAMITSLQGADNISENYAKAKAYAEGLQGVLMKVDANTTLNLTNLQSITEEMIKQGIVLDGNNAAQVEGFTRLANAVAVYSNNGRNEIQVRQEVSALLRGEVDQNSQLASMIQRTVNGPLREWVEKHKQAGDLTQAIGEKLSGFGLAAKDLATSWGAVKSSLETSVNLILRAGFADIVKDLVGWLDSVNKYLREHQELIGNRIKSAWDEFKSIAKMVAPVIKEIYEHASLFVGLFVGGAFIKGLTTAYGLYKDILGVVKSIAVVQVGTAVAAAGGAAAGGAAAGKAAGSTLPAFAAADGYLGGLGGAAAGGAAAGGAAAGGAAAGKAASGVAAAGWLSRIAGVLPFAAGIGSFLYTMSPEQLNSIDEVAKINAYGQNSSPTLAAAPQVNLQDSQEQIKRKTELMQKELSAFKELESSKATITEKENEIEIYRQKDLLEQKKILNEAYAKEETRIAEETAQSKFNAAKEYYYKEKEFLDYIKTKKGESSPEYQEELAKNRKAKLDMDVAELDRTLTAVKGITKITEARKKDLIEQQKQIEAEREHTRIMKDLKDELDRLNGTYVEETTLEKTVRDEKEKLAALENKLAMAKIEGEDAAIMRINQEIAATKSLYVEKSRLAVLEDQRRADAQALSDATGTWNGTIVGFNGNTPIYANDWNKNQYQYVSPYDATSSVSSGGGGFVESNIFHTSPGDPFMPSYAVGTNYVPQDGLAYLHKGEAVIPAKYNGKDSGGGTINVGGITISLPNVTRVTESEADDIARLILPRIQKLSARYV